MAVTREQVANSVHEIIRKDLKFSGIELGDSLELVGGGLGLDSLDLLTLVTGIEKSFGHKIAAKRLNRETMATVGGFVDFVYADLVAAGK